MKKTKYPNRVVTNVKSPKNEKDYRKSYQEMNPKANIKDNLDISAVVTKDGEKGHALLNQEFNRSKDKNHHRGKNFISDVELRKHMKDSK